MSFGKRLKSLLAQKGFSQTTFAAGLGLTRARLCNYINERSEPDAATLCRIADALAVSTDLLLGRADPRNADFQGSALFSDFVPGREKPASAGDEDGGTVWIPLYASRPGTPGSELSGAEAGEAESPQPSGWLRETGTSVPTGEFRRPYALILSDDSMAPQIMPGDIVHIQPRFIYHPFMEQNPGRDLFGVRLDAGDTVGTSLKRCSVRNNLLICYSDNTRYAPIVLDMNRILFVPLIGKVVSLWRKYPDSGLPDQLSERLGEAAHA